MPTTSTHLQLSDAAVIVASRKDPARFAEIFDRHWPTIHRYCVSRAGAAGEDIAAETFRVALDSCRRYDRTREDAAPWLFGIATNLLRRGLRSKSRHAGALQRLDPPEEADLSDETLDRLEAEALGPKLTEALGQLPAIYRDTLLLHVWGDLTYEQGLSRRAPALAPRVAIPALRR
jgi:RNA polymerase sigma factor (sigma-70 family)